MIGRIIERIRKMWLHLNSLKQLIGIMWRARMLWPFTIWWRIRNRIWEITHDPPASIRDQLDEIEADEENRLDRLNYAMKEIGLPPIRK